MEDENSKYDAYIVDPDTTTRMRLKQATNSAPQFGTVVPLHTLSEALGRVNGSEKCDVVFLSYGFEEVDIASFIKSAKASPQGQDAAYVLVLKANDQDNSTVAKNVMIGADGFLFEPYSLESLLVITNLASKVRFERAQTRQAAAIKLLVTDMMQKIDLIAYLKVTGHEIGRHMGELREKRNLIQSFDDQGREVFQKAVLEVFENAPQPRALPAHPIYKGASTRLKKKMQKKIAEEFARGTK